MMSLVSAFNTLYCVVDDSKFQVEPSGFGG